MGAAKTFNKEEYDDAKNSLDEKVKEEVDNELGL